MNLTLTVPGLEGAARRRAARNEGVALVHLSEIHSAPGVFRLHVQEDAQACGTVGVWRYLGQGGCV